MNHDNPAAPPIEIIIAQTCTWLEQAVIGLNLCPFARAVHTKNQIDYRVSRATDETGLTRDLAAAMQALIATPAEITDTCLLIHPWALQDFMDYNDFLDVAEALLRAAGLDGVLQIASFHPNYLFAGTDPEDISHCTNRSPYPMLHLLREDSLYKAIAAIPDADLIVERNLATMYALGNDGWEALQQRIRASHKPSN